MKTAKRTVQVKDSDKIREYRFPAAVGVICACICVALLSFTIMDCEKYSADDYLPTSITFSPPEEQRSEGFWDIFTTSLMNLLKAY